MGFLFGCKPYIFFNWLFYAVQLILIWFILSFQDKDFFEECKKEYLKKREDFQMNYVESGKTADMKKKESVIA